MTIVIFGIDALDPDLVDPGSHPHLMLDDQAVIETIVSSNGEPSTHELWPTIITGLPPTEHGLELDDGVAWENPVLSYGSRLAEVLLPDTLQTKIGAWLLNNTAEDAFRVPASYYRENGLETIFDGYNADVIGIPNYVVDQDEEDREHELRRNMGELFKRDPDAESGHRSEDPVAFYELCLEMAMVRTALVRRAFRSREHELVFGYTSGLDLIGHVAYDVPTLQERAYEELNDFVGELRSDLGPDDELILVSDHGLQDGVHTDEAMIASTCERIVTAVGSVVDFKAAVERELEENDHQPTPPSHERRNEEGGERVKEQLEDLGYM